MKRIVDACYPSWSEEASALWAKRNREPSERELKEAWNKEAQELWHDIKAVKFGNSTLWDDSTFLSLATYQIPEDAAYMLILRTECYITTFDPTAVGFAQFGPPPLGTAAWQYTDLSVGNSQYRITPQVPMHILCDTDEMLFAKGDHLLELIISTTSADEATVDRFIRTTVYGYLCGAKIAGRIGSGESTYYGQTDE